MHIHQHRMYMNEHLHTHKNGKSFIAVTQFIHRPRITGKENPFSLLT